MHYGYKLVMGIIIIQWNPTIKDTIGDLHFVLYRGVSLTEGLCVIHFIDHQYYLCMYAHDGNYHFYGSQPYIQKIRTLVEKLRSDGLL